MSLAPLVFALGSGKGLYVPLIGSGVSTGAGIPTGHKVMLDLIAKLATVEGVDPGSDPLQWYAARYGLAASYSGLLERISQTPGERANLLRGYFEPDEADIAAGRKQPTRAHTGLARLTKRGFFKLILTTNFDTLIERALGAEGIDPTVVSRPEQIEALPPLSHIDVTLVKLHGDYRELLTLNTSAELSAYAPSVDAFLRRVLGDYGLIVIGWSGEHDVALRAVVEAHRSRHYGTYWVHRGPLAGAARDLVTAREAMPIAVADADMFLHELSEGLDSLERSGREAASDADVLLARLKTYIQADDRWIDLDELVTGAARSAVRRVSAPRFAYTGESFNQNTLTARVAEYEAITSPLARLLVAGVYWGRQTQEPLWIGAVQRLIPDVEWASGTDVWIELADYSALLLLYSLGMAGVLGRKPDFVIRLLEGGRARYAREDRLWLFRLNPWFLPDSNLFRMLPGLTNRRCPVSERLLQVVGPLMTVTTAENNQIEDQFDEWELLLSLSLSHERQLVTGDPRTPVGRFAWRHHDQRERSVIARFERAIAAEGGNWPYIRAGLCGGNPARVTELLNALKKQQEMSRFDPS